MRAPCRGKVHKCAPSPTKITRALSKGMADPVRARMTRSLRWAKETTFTSDDILATHRPSHHLNYFVLGDQLGMTPLFLGFEPVQETSGQRQGVVMVQQEQNDGLEMLWDRGPQNASNTSGLLRLVSRPSNLYAPQVPPQVIAGRFLLDDISRFSGGTIGRASPGVPPFLRFGVGY
jgi:hypothetical protein